MTTISNNKTTQTENEHLKRLYNLSELCNKKALVYNCRAGLYQQLYNASNIIILIVIIITSVIPFITDMKYLNLVTSGIIAFIGGTREIYDPKKKAILKKNASMRLKNISLLIDDYISSDVTDLRSFANYIQKEIDEIELDIFTNDNTEKVLTV